MRRTQQMNVITVAANSLKLNVITLADLMRRFDNDVLYILIKEQLAVLHRKYDVIVDLPSTMARFMNKARFHLLILKA